MNKYFSDIMLGAGWFFTGWAGFAAIPVILSSVASIFAIYNYYLQIKKSRRKF